MDNFLKELKVICKNNNVKANFIIFSEIPEGEFIQVKGNNRSIIIKFTKDDE
jgi:hypothetical protein